MKIRSTTVLAVLRDGRGAIGSDGQVTLGNTAVKHGAVKVRPLFGGQVLAGFAGGAADAFSSSRSSRVTSSATAATSSAPRSRWRASGGATASCVGSRR
jgi:hypothetical protein